MPRQDMQTSSVFPKRYPLGETSTGEMVGVWMAASYGVLLRIIAAMILSQRIPRQRNEPRFDARAQLYRLCVVDLTQAPGFQSRSRVGSSGRTCRLP